MAFKTARATAFLCANHEENLKTEWCMPAPPTGRNPRSATLPCRFQRVVRSLEHVMSWALGGKLGNQWASIRGRSRRVLLPNPVLAPRTAITR